MFETGKLFIFTIFTWEKSTWRNGFSGGMQYQSKNVRTQVALLLRSLLDKYSLEIFTLFYLSDIDMMVRVFANSPGDLSSIP